MRCEDISYYISSENFKFSMIDFGKALASWWEVL